MIKPYKVTQYAMAVLLILTSIAIAIFQVHHIDDVATGVLMYIAQAFLLAGSIFGLDLYVKTSIQKNENNIKRNPKQQPSKH